MYATRNIAVLLTALRFATAQNLDEYPVTGTLGNASVVENNPPGVVFKAILPDNEFFDPRDPRGNIKGSVTAVANPNGIGVAFQVQFENLPTSGGPFLYHLHAFPVPADGSCNGTLGHLDPTQRGETPACDSSLPQTCQVGDLSGKYGEITSDPFIASYKDDFASTLEGIGAFFGNRSLTVHFANTTRITCANFTLDAGNGNGNVSNTTSLSKASPTATTTAAATTIAAATTSSRPAKFTGAASTSTSAASLLSLTAITSSFFLLQDISLCSIL